MTIAEKVVGLLPSGSKPSAEPAADDGEEDGEPAGLYECSSCGTTFISESMDVCPDCETSVESVPTEKDLGMV